jgi:hypothetical protein
MGLLVLMMAGTISAQTTHRPCPDALLSAVGESFELPAFDDVSDRR